MAGGNNSLKKSHFSKMSNLEEMRTDERNSSKSDSWIISAGELMVLKNCAGIDAKVYIRKLINDCEEIYLKVSNLNKRLPKIKQNTP